MNIIQLTMALAAIAGEDLSPEVCRAMREYSEWTSEFFRNNSGNNIARQDVPESDIYRWTSRIEEAILKGEKPKEG